MPNSSEAARSASGVSSSKTVSARPAGPSSRAFNDCHGVRVGAATSAAPPATSRRVQPSASSTSKASRICPVVGRPTSTSSIKRR